ncbi:MAG: HAMP domain-containing histidine kinase [Clostridiales bacterium]|nr:HAMP domain-containing histidine kinase [Clostridiales bacterium]
MKYYRKYIIAVIVYFAVWAVAVYFIGTSLTAKAVTNRTAFMNRMTAQIEQTGDTSAASFTRTFTPDDIADVIEVYSLEDMSSMQNVGGGNNTYVWTLKDADGTVMGFVRYEYKSDINHKMIVLSEVSIVVALIPLIAFMVYVHRKVLRPFNEFSEYPVKLSKGLATEGLPETKSRLFGKYIWGMNMLNDRLDADRKQIDRLMYDRKKFVSVLAHGIKTPVANIKLYSEAIETGLYRGGVPDEEDKKIAIKIGKNADDIAGLVSEILDDPGSLRSSYEPTIGSFYLEDIKTRVMEDFGNRLKVSAIPFEVEQSGNPMVTSDLEAIIRCVFQVMENAIKYGDGTGIKMRLYRQDDLTFISIKNNGATLSESEMPFVFNCYWRGSNSSGKEGSGIGLYEARSIIRKLGGDIMMKVEDGATEVVMYL